jgi:hypothetical protein
LYNGPPAPGESVVPINLGTGPSQFYANIGVSKTFNFGPKPESPAAPADATAASSSGPPAKPVGRYSLEFSAYARNAFNQVSLAAPVGVIGNPYPQSNFLHSFSLAIQSPANRQIFLFLRFGF